MSKSAVALIATWVVFGLVGAFFGGYFLAKKNVCKLDDKNGENVIINGEKPNDTFPNSATNTAPNPTSNDSNKTIIQPNQQK